MTVRFGHRFALTVRLEALERASGSVPQPPLGADDGELVRWSSRPVVDMDQARWAALTLLHGGGPTH